MSLKSVSQNTIIYSLGTLALRFTTFLLIPLYTHYLTKSEFGLLQTLLFTIQIIITINDVGMRSALMRYFSEFQQKNKLAELLGSSLTINLIVGFLFLVIAFLVPNSLISHFFDFEVIPNLLLITVFVGVSQTMSLNILSYFRAQDQGIRYMLISLGTSLILILTTYFALVSFNFGILGVLYAQALTFTVMWLSVFIWIVFKHGIKIRTHTISSLAKFGYPLIFAMSGDLIINTSGSFLLGHFRSLEEVAIFSLGYKIAAIAIMILVGPFQMAYEPFIFRNKNNSELKSIISKLSTYVLLAYLFVCIGILILFKDLIVIIGKGEYNEAYYLLFLLLPGIGCTIYNYIGQSLLHFNNKTKTTGLIVLSTTFLSIVLSYFLINYFGILGLVISLNFYLIVSSYLLLYFGMREIKICLELNRIVLIVIIGIALFTATYYLSFYESFIFYLSMFILLAITVSYFYFSRFFIVDEKRQIKVFLNAMFARVEL